MESDVQQILNKHEQKVLLLLSSPVDGLSSHTVAVGLKKLPNDKLHKVRRHLMSPNILVPGGRLGTCHLSE